MSEPTASELPVVHLASRSPRRRELLHQLGVRPTVVDAPVDERVLPGEAAAHYVARVAVAKAAAGAALLAPRCLVLAADTAVVVGGRILGKPVDAADAERHLALLSGRTHQVISVVALDGRTRATRSSVSEVTFRAVSAAERAAYCRTGEPLDKAGGYAIQGLAAVFVRHLSGSYSGVMGLPLFETAELLAGAGVRVLPQA